MYDSSAMQVDGNSRMSWKKDIKRLPGLGIADCFTVSRILKLTVLLEEFFGWTEVYSKNS